MRYVLGSVLGAMLAVSVTLVTLVWMADRVSAETIISAPAPAAEPVEDTVPVRPMRIAMTWGDRLSFRHDAPICWDFNQGPRGRWRAVIIDDEREYPGETCAGRRLAIVRLPRGIMEDEIYVWQVGPMVMLWIPDYSPL